MAEKWKSINGFDGLYEVSDLGRIKALNRLVENNGGMQRKKERILKQRVRPGDGHCTVVLCKDGKTYPRLVHRLVAEAFIPNPEGKPVVDHIDTNPANNAVSNLRWVTVQENCLNPLTRRNNSTSKKGHPYYGRPLTLEERQKIAEANKGRVASEETRKRLSESHKQSEKAIASSRANIRKAIESNIGKKATQETRDKIRDRLIGVHKGKSWKVIDGKRVWYQKGD